MDRVELGRRPGLRGPVFSFQFVNGLASYLFLHRALVSECGRPRQGVSLALTAMFTLALFWRELGWAVAAVAVFGAAWMLVRTPLWRAALIR